jgi:limonene-1,2-epoxide hydrolase
LLTSDDTVTVNKGVKIIAGNKAAMAALREFDKKFARVSTVSSRAITSADDANDRVNASKGRVFITDGQTPGDGH